jgi:predicted PurR-regulated permease PerM
MDNSVKTIIILIFVIIVFVLLYVIQSILLPLVLAFFAAALFQPLVSFLRKLKIPMFIILPFVLIFSIFILFGIYQVIQNTFTEIIAQSDYLADRLNERSKAIFSWANHTFGARLSFNKLYRNAVDQMDPNWIAKRTTDILAYATSFGSSIFMFLIYYVVLLAGMANYKKYFEYVENFDPDSKITHSYEKVQKAINSYLVIKTMLCLIMGFAAYLICLSFGIKFALFWGFLTFVVSYIPNIGAVISTVFPILMAIVEFDSFQIIFLFSLLLFGVHMILGTVVEPIIMGSNMSINTITVIFGLVFWGFIWGIPGMMLSVPLLVVFKLVLEQFPSTEVISRVMGVPKKL